jgi:hypothetical protein
VLYATAMGAKLTSNSWGGGAYSQALYDAINDAATANCLFVAAAGNNNSSFVEYPAGYDLNNVISVAPLILMTPGRVSKLRRHMGGPGSTGCWHLSTTRTILIPVLVVPQWLALMWPELRH